MRASSPGRAGLMGDDGWSLGVSLDPADIAGLLLEMVVPKLSDGGAVFILERGHRMMQNICSGDTGQHVRMQFDVSGCHREQQELLRQLQASTVLGSAISLGYVERE